MKRLMFWLFVMLLAGCSSTDNGDGGIPEVARIATNLESPWSIDSDGEQFFISERDGAIVRIDPDGKMIREEVFLSEPLSSAAEAGLLGFVLQSDFNESSLAYAYYTYDSNGKPVNRIVTLLRDEEGWHEQEILLDNIESGRVHHGGRLALSPDGTLFATIGDGAVPENAQDPHLAKRKDIEAPRGWDFHHCEHGASESTRTCLERRRRTLFLGAWTIRK